MADSELNEDLTTVEVTCGPMLKDEMYYRQYFESHGGPVEDVTFKTHEGKVLVTFECAKVAKRVASEKHRIDGKDVQLRLMETSPFYPDKLLFENVSQKIAKEVLLMYMENISGQEQIDIFYSDSPGKIVVVFQLKIVFSKIRMKCQAKPLIGCKLEVRRIPLSTCIMVKNLNPNSSDDDVAHYFESVQAGGSKVLKVQGCEEEAKCVFFEDFEAAERVAMKRHILDGRDLQVRVYLECLGPSGGRKDPYVLILPEALELTVSSNIKIRFLQRSPVVLQEFNKRLSKVHAFARISEDTLKVECTLNEREPEADLLVTSWRDKVVNMLDTCFQLVRIDRIDVLPDIWSDVLEVLETCDLSGDLLILLSDERAFVILSQTDTERDTVKKVTSIVRNEEKKFASKNCEVSETKDLSQHEVDFLIISSFHYKVMAQFNTLRVDIDEQERKITFCGLLPDVREVQLKMLEMLRCSSMLDIRMTEDKMSILANTKTRKLIREKLTSSGLVASWELQTKGVVTVYCADGSDLQRAIQVIQLSLGEETLPLDEVSLEVMKIPSWSRLKEHLIKQNNGVLSITSTANTLKITAFSVILPDVKKSIVNFLSENSSYTTVFRFSPSRQKFLTLFWEERLNDIVEKLSNKTDIILDSLKGNIIVKGTNQGIKTVRTKLEELEQAIVCTEESVTKEETILYLVGLKNLSELELIARAHQCIISLTPEESGIKIVTTNQPLKQALKAERLQQEVCGVHLIIKQGDITEEDVDAIVTSANPEFDLTQGALSKLLKERCGEALQQECSSKIADMRKHKRIVTSAPNLKCRHIVHIDGVFYMMVNDWKKAYTAVLQETEKRGFCSLAVPALGTGGCQLFPRDSARAFANALTTHKLTMKTLQDVTVVLTDKETEQAFTDILSSKAKEDAVQISDLSEPPRMDIDFSTDLGGVHLTIKQGDITEEEVDAIVTSANPDFDFSQGAVSKLLKEKCGEDLQRECISKISVADMREYKRIVTSAHHLKCKHIVHIDAVFYLKCRDWEKAYTTVLEEAEKSGFGSIALPALGTGACQVSPSDSAKALVNALVAQEQTPKTLQRVAVVLIDRATVQVFIDVLRLAEKQGGPKTALPLTHTIQSGGSINFAGVHLTIKQGDITEEEVDAIVTSATSNLQYTQGAVSKTLNAKCGEALQRECKSKLSDMRQHKRMVTSAPNLKCKHIVHIDSAFYSKSNAWQNAYTAVLQEAEKSGFHSLAVPALGTENPPASLFSSTFYFLNNLFHETKECNLSPSDSARAFADALTAQKQTLKTLRAITVVLSDTVSEQAFTNALRWKEKQSVAQESSIKTDLEDVHLTILQGDITEAKVDAIVNSSNPDFDFTQGAVSKILRAKCGEALQRECNSMISEMVQHKIVVTSAYSLKCKHILHIDAMFYSEYNDWEKAYTAVLQEAERQGFRSLAVPALGTGACQLSPSDSAHALAHALSIQRRTLKKLRQVAVVLYDSATVKTFNDVLRGKTKEDAGKTSSMSVKDVPEKTPLSHAKETSGRASDSRCDTPDVFKLYIFSSNEEKKAGFCKAFYDFVDAKYDCKEIKNVKQLSPEEVEQIRKECKSLNVDVQKKGAGLVLKGMTEDVKKCRERIRTLVKKKERQHQENVMANLVQWYYFEKTSGTEQKAFGRRENLVIEEAFHAFQNEQMSETVDISDGNDHAFVINFSEMKKYNKRKPYDGTKIMRKEIVKDGASSSSLLPKEWELHEEEEDVKIGALPTRCAEYQNVKSNFLKTAEGVFSLVSINRIQNPELYKQYIAKKAQMDKQNKGMQSEKTLWHGTSCGAIRNINRYGFNRSFCGKNAAVYGQGVYFAVNSSYSMHDQYSPPDSSGRKYIYQCKVLVGYSTKGTDQMRILPRRNKEIRYDSATNNEDNPEMFVIFHDLQAYPEYLIIFKQASDIQS